KPDGARVLAAGQERGRTPVRFELAVGQGVVAIDVLHDGFIPYHLGVRPDVDQKYVLSLERYRAPASAPRDIATASPSPSAAPTPTVAIPAAAAPSPSVTSSASFRRFDEPSFPEGKP